MTMTTDHDLEATAKWLHEWFSQNGCMAYLKHMPEDTPTNLAKAMLSTRAVTQATREELERVTLKWVLKLPNEVRNHLLQKHVTQLHDAILALPGLSLPQVNECNHEHCPRMWTQASMDAAKLEADEILAVIDPPPGSLPQGSDWPALNDDLREILGRMCFQCGHLARAFRAAGHNINTKAEDEQAFVIHWLVGLYLKHGSGWRAKAAEEVSAMIAAPATEGSAG